jgi:hypothetical protein
MSRVERLETLALNVVTKNIERFNNLELIPFHIADEIIIRLLAEQELSLGTLRFVDSCWLFTSFRLLASQRFCCTFLVIPSSFNASWMPLILQFPYLEIVTFRACAITPKMIEKMSKSFQLKGLHFVSYSLFASIYCQDACLKLSKEPSFLSCVEHLKYFSLVSWIIDRFQQPDERLRTPAIVASSQCQWFARVIHFWLQEGETISV